MSHESVYVVIDIETVANQRAAAYYATKRYEAPSNYKDPAKIESAIREKRQSDMEKAALSWWTGRVACLCASVIGYSVTEPPRDFFHLDEKTLLTSFFDWLCTIDQKYGRPIVTGKSTDYFDVPFLIGRAIAQDLGIHDCFRPRYPMSDIDKIFSASAHCDQRGKLADYAFGMQTGGKLAHGTDVAAMWVDILQEPTPANWKKLTDYCARDNDIAITMLTRWLKPYITSTTPAPAEPTPLEIPFG